MKRHLAAILMAGSISLAACTTTPEQDEQLEDVGEGAAIGTGVGTAAGLVIPGLSPIEGAVIGMGIGGLAGAVWNDRDGDGRADGYVHEGRYYPGEPPGYKRCRSVTAGAVQGGAAGAVLGAGAGAVIGGINPLEGALIGAAVGGLAGAVWADRNNDGCVDGYYVREGTYYEGAPPRTRLGERG